MFHLERLVRDVPEVWALCTAVLVVAALYFAWRWRAQPAGASSAPPLQRRRSDRTRRKLALRLVHPPSFPDASHDEEPAPDASVPGRAAPPPDP